jgi:hypothetical protein
MEGNNKADALCAGTGEVAIKTGGIGCQRIFFSNPDVNVAVIYGTSRTGMHLWVVRKSGGVA